MSAPLRIELASNQPRHTGVAQEWSNPLIRDRLLMQVQPPVVFNHESQHAALVQQENYGSVTRGRECNSTQAALYSFSLEVEHHLYTMERTGRYSQRIFLQTRSSVIEQAPYKGKIPGLIPGASILSQDRLIGRTSVSCAGNSESSSLPGISAPVTQSGQSSCLLSNASSVQI